MWTPEREPLSPRRALGPAHAGNPIAIAGELPSHERDGDQARRIELVHESPQREIAAQRTVPRGDQLVDLELPDHVARPVPGLLQVQVLLAPDGLAVQPH